ncbi:Kinesin-like protein KIF15 [Trichinella spiralis]|uniref:Kinesin-like protein KIF15 n=1 Tax=Trichinella spiralis TaxID=6334 RepID=A0A0V1BE63_TRISP|nr:Kinesin-like protein KIF15 [Trichinella spiralis]
MIITLFLFFRIPEKQWASFLLTYFANSKQFAAGKVTKMIQLEEDEELENSTVYAISILIELQYKICYYCFHFKERQVYSQIFTFDHKRKLLFHFNSLQEKPLFKKNDLLMYINAATSYLLFFITVINVGNIREVPSFVCCALFSEEMLENSADFIKVIVRLRPLPNSGIPSLVSCAEVKDDCHISLKTYPRTFTFDRIADESATQESMFTCVGKSIIDGCVEGYNGTIFAYGQTGSGKTYTMIGPCANESSVVDDKLRGIIPRSLEYLFSRIEEITQTQNVNFLCKCSFVEMYNEQLYDLLDATSSKLTLRESVKLGVFVEGLSEVTVCSAADAYKVLRKGCFNRRVASTSMNRESSRSHAVFTIIIESRTRKGCVENVRISHFNLVDLAGSERQKTAETDDARLKEASSINKSLSVLGKVITALVQISQGKHCHVPYRDSKLTFLLRDSLGGNAKTCIIANIYPVLKSFGDVLSTLQFAQRAKLVQNRAVINEDVYNGGPPELLAEIQRLKAILRNAQLGRRCTIAEFVPIDLTAENPLGAEFCRAMRLIGKLEADKAVQGIKLAMTLQAWRALYEENETAVQKLSILLKLKNEETTAIGVKNGCDVQMRNENLKNLEKITLLNCELEEVKAELRSLKAFGKVADWLANEDEAKTKLEDLYKRLRFIFKDETEKDNELLETVIADSTVDSEMKYIEVGDAICSVIFIFNKFVLCCLQLMREKIDLEKEFEKYKLAKTAELTAAQKKIEEVESSLQLNRLQTNFLNDFHDATMKVLTPTRMNGSHDSLNCKSPSEIGKVTPKQNLLSSPLDNIINGENFETWFEELKKLKADYQARVDEIADLRKENEDLKLSSNSLKDEHVLHVVESGQEIAKLQEKLDKVTAELNISKAKFQELSSANDALKEELATRNADYEKLQILHVEQEKKHERLFEPLKNEVGLNTELRVALDTLKLENEDLALEKENLKINYEELEAKANFDSYRLADLEENASREAERRKCLEKDLLQMKDIVNELSGDLSEASGSGSPSSTSCQQLINKMLDFQRRVATLEASENHLKTENENLFAEIAQQAEVLKENMAQQAQLRTAYDQLKFELEVVVSDRDSALEENQRLSGVIDQMMHQIDEYKKNADVETKALKDIIEKLEFEKAEEQTRMKELENKSRDKIDQLEENLKNQIAEHCSLKKLYEEKSEEVMTLKHMLEEREAASKLDTKEFMDLLAEKEKELESVKKKLTESLNLLNTFENTLTEKNAEMKMLKEKEADSEKKLSQMGRIISSCEKLKEVNRLLKERAVNKMTIAVSKLKAKDNLIENLQTLNNQLKEAVAEKDNLIENLQQKAATLDDALKKANEFELKFSQEKQVLQSDVANIQQEKSFFEEKFFNLLDNLENLDKEYAVLVGHKNPKQKIHYVRSLQHIKYELMRENISLKEELATLQREISRLQLSNR